MLETPGYRAYRPSPNGRIRVRAPGLSELEARRVAQMCDLLLSGLIPAISDARGSERRRLQDEAKLVLLRYLQPIDEGSR